jgi:hypothetical protein
MVLKLAPQQVGQLTQFCAQLRQRWLLRMTQPVGGATALTGTCWICQVCSIIYAWQFSHYWSLAAVVFPVGKFSADSEVPTPKSTPRNEVEKFIQDQWNPATYDNAPISLQLVGRRHNEEKLLAMLNVVEQVFQKHSNPNGTMEKVAQIMGHKANGIVNGPVNGYDR